MKLLLNLLFILTAFKSLSQGYLEPEIYSLDNGLKVYMMPDKAAKTAYGMVVVKAGARQEPADATGLAHYLEHLLFKGTDRMGTSDYQKEKPFLDSISVLYGKLKNCKNEPDRKEVNRLINEQEVLASGYGLPTEFDNLLTGIGSTRTNAFTSWDITAYHNQFPGEQIEKWLTLYSERFRNPVFRSFQSELEVVYEEKNRAADNFESILMEKMNFHLYPGHPYGQRTVIGTTEHLKNPPINRIREFFDTWYVANNMALMLVGNFDPVLARKFISEKFSGLRSAKLPADPTIVVPPLKESKSISLRVSPIRLEAFGYRTVNSSHEDNLVLELISGMCNNQKESGLFDGLMQDGKVLACFMESDAMAFDGSATIVIVPKIIGQSFHKAEMLVMAEFDKIKNGSFSDEFFRDVKKDLVQDHLSNMEYPEGRVMQLLDEFAFGNSWDMVKNYQQIVEKITREDVMRVARKYFAGVRIQVRSRTGFPKKDKIAKPGFKALKNNKNSQSEFAARFRQADNTEIIPKFISPETDVVQKDLGRGNKLFVSQNPYNKLASMMVKFNAGQHLNPYYAILPMAMDNATPEGFELKEFKKKQAELNCSVFFYWEKEFLCARISGEEGNIFRMLSLLNKILRNPQLSASSLELVHSRMEVSVKQEKKRPSEMGRALREFVLYGNKSDYLNRPKLSDLKSIDREQIAGLMKEISSNPGSLHYCGTLTPDAVMDSVQKHFSMPGSGNIRSNSIQPVLPSKNTIYLVHDKKARQSQVYFMAMADPLRTEDESHYALLNEYLGGGFSGLILQEIREFKSLAYSAYGRFERLMPKGNPLLFNAYLGCQSDKTNEAVKTMLDVIRNMPAYPERIPGFKTYFESSISSRYPDFRDLSGQAEGLLMNGYQESPLLPAWRNLKSASFEGMMEFYRNNLQNKPFAITIYGDKRKMDMNKLREYGEIIELKSSDLVRE